MKKFKIYLEAKIFAIKRRLNILLFGNFDPYPKIYKNYKIMGIVPFKIQNISLKTINKYHYRQKNKITLDLFPEQW